MTLFFAESTHLTPALSPLKGGEGEEAPSPPAGGGRGRGERWRRPGECRSGFVSRIGLGAAHLTPALSPLKGGEGAAVGWIADEASR